MQVLARVLERSTGTSDWLFFSKSLVFFVSFIPLTLLRALTVPDRDSPLRESGEADQSEHTGARRSALGGEQNNAGRHKVSISS